MFDILFHFLDPFAEAEKEYLKREYGLTEECAGSASALLKNRLAGLVEPLALQIYQEELERIAPTVIPGVSFAGDLQKKEAEAAASERLSGADNIFKMFPQMELYRRRITDNFRLFMETLLKRLNRYGKNIKETLPGCGDPEEILGFSASGADFHLHGSCTLRLKTAGGAFYYKPRDCRPDAMFREIAERFFDGRICSPPVLIGEDGFGFVGEVRPAGVVREEDVSAYYRNFGILLALLRSLGASDMHYENIIASGIYPVSIDLETVLTPLYRTFAGTDFHEIGQLDTLSRDLMFSAADTMVLPMLLQGKTEMSPLLKKGAGCLPVLNGSERTVRGYESAFAEGFAEGYDTVLEHRDSIYDVLKSYGSMFVRFVLRASSYYAITLREMHAETFLTNPSEKERELGSLKDRFEDLSNEELDALVSWEKEALEEGDIPHFSVRADSRSLYGDPKEMPLVRDFLSFSPIEHAELCLAHMGNAEKRFELDFLRVSLLETPGIREQAEKNAGGLRSRETLDPMHSPETSEPVLSPREALETAEALFRKICGLSVFSSDGNLVFLSAGDHMSPRYLPGFAKGMQGMALFFEALRKASPSCRKEAEELLDFCRRDTRKVLEAGLHSDGKGFDTSRIGLERGFGGILLSPAFDAADLEMILQILRKELPGEISGTIRTDLSDNLSNGLAGLAVGLSEWTDSAGFSAECRQLLADSADFGAECRQILADIADRLAESEDALKGPGLLRGKAGVAYALALCAQSADTMERKDRWIRKSTECFEKIRMEYSERLTEWPDPERSDRPLFPGCGLETGAPGIGLAAACCLHTVPGAEEVLALAADSICSHGLPETDIIRKGVCGAVLCLLEASVRLGRPEYLTAAGRMLAKTVRRAEENGGFRVTDLRYTNAPDPSFLDGYAGIGYVFLRYAELSGAADHPSSGVFPAV